MLLENVTRSYWVDSRAIAAGGIIRTIVNHKPLEYFGLIDICSNSFVFLVTLQLERWAIDRRKQAIDQSLVQPQIKVYENTVYCLHKFEITENRQKNV